MGLFEEQVMDVLNGGGRCCGRPQMATVAGSIKAPTVPAAQMASEASCFSDKSHGCDDALLDLLEAIDGAIPAKASVQESPEFLRVMSNVSLASMQEAPTTTRKVKAPVQENPNFLRVMSNVSLASMQEPPTATRKRTALQPIAEPKQLKSWKNAKPSNYCHSCGGVAARGDKVVCDNFEVGTCRKVFCRPCIEKIYGTWDADAMAQGWECTHCRGACPEKASCRYYSKTNSKRSNKSRRLA